MKMLMSLLLLLCPLAVFASLPQVNFTFSSRDIIEGQEVTLTAELSTLTPNGVLVPFTVSGSANSDDHDLIPGTIYISPNHKRGSITFRVFEDEISEGTESIVVSMLAPANANLGSIRNHTIYIHDAEEDNLPIVNFSASSSNNHEGELVFVEATLSSPSSQIVIVPFVVGGSAQFPGDHNLISGNLTFFPGSTTATLSVLINEDGENEGDETISIQLNAPVVNATLGSNTAHTIIIKAPTIVQPSADFSINLENGGYIPFQGHFDASSSYVPGHENEADRGITSCTWSLSGGNTGDKTIIVSGCQYNPTIIVKGNYSLTLTVTGIGGGLATITKNFQAHEAVQPVADFSINLSNGGVAPTRAALNGMLSYVPGHDSEPDRGIASCTWSLSGPSTGDKKITIPSCLYEPQLVDKGHYSLTLTVTSLNNTSASMTKSFDVLENQLPTASFSVDPESGVAPLKISLNASGSLDPDGGVISEYHWDFGNGDTLITTNTIANYTFQNAGAFIIKLVVKDNEGTLSPIKTFNILVTPLVTQGTITGITYHENLGIIANAGVTIRFSSNNTQFSTTSDTNGKFSFNIPLSGDYVINAENGNFKGSTTGSLTQDHNSEEVPLKLVKTGIGKVSGNIYLINGNIPADGSVVGLKFSSDDQVVYTTADVNGHFLFENLPLNGSFWLSSFHPSTGSRRNIFAFIDSATPEQQNLTIMQITPTSVPTFTNGAFTSGDLSNWFSIGDNVLVPQSSAFGNTNTGDKFFVKNNSKSRIPLLVDFFHSRAQGNIARRTHLKDKKFSNVKSLALNTKTLPCENSIYSAITSTSGVLGTQLSQEITIEADAETLIGRVKFLTNETLESAAEGYNDDFVGVLINQFKPKFIFLKDVKNINWGPGKFGFLYSSNEIAFAIDVKHLAGLRATLAVGTIDKGDDRGDSAVIVSNLQFLKSSDRNFVELGSINGDMSINKNVGAVSWFKVKNNQAISAINLNQNNFHVLKNNQEIEIPTVKFGNEPSVKNFIFDLLSSSDIFSYSLDSTWVSGMPTSSCSVGGL